MRISYDTSSLRGLIIAKYGSLRAFASEMGVHPSTLGKWLSNAAYMRSSTIERMAELLGLAAEDVQTTFFAVRS